MKLSSLLPFARSGRDVRLTSYAKCAGWAAKLPAQDLVKVLSPLEAFTDDRLLVDTSTWDDAGVAALDDQRARVQSVDFFPPLVDDPTWFGRIAAANALSDLYAMGAKPFSALAVVVFPKDDLPLDVLTRILQGGGATVKASGAMPLGGHTVVGEGILYGLAVTGLVAPDRVVRNASAQAGDALYLTKRLGTGAITTAGRKGRIDDALLKAACEQMATLNAAAAAVMAAVPSVRAATDVTGFGLAGHAAEMASAAGVDIVLDAAALPVLDGARDALAAGHVSGGSERTLEFHGERLVFEGATDNVTRQLVTDAETSGGLLISVPADDAGALEAAARERDVLAARVGEVVAATGEGVVRVR